MDRIDYANTILYAGVLNNLADIYGHQHDYVRAEELLQRALAIGEQLKGPDCWFITSPLNFVVSSSSSCAWRVPAGRTVAEPRARHLRQRSPSFR